MTRFALALTLSMATIGALAPAASAKPLPFQSPTKNIGCYLDTKGVRCDIRSRRWKPPAAPRSCDLDYGQGLAVDTRGKGQFVCAGDTTLGSGRIVGYGGRVSQGRFTCAVRTSGVRCLNRRNRHGFALSVQGYRRF